jgi:hypothetical protein
LRTWVIVIATVLVTSALTTLTIYAIAPSLFGLSRAEILRFYKPEVLEGDPIGYTRLDLGTWAPRHPTNNAIISAILYFQYLTPENTSLIRFGFVISPGGAQLNSDGLASSSRTEYSQSKAYVCPLPNPNCDNYTISFGFYNHDTSNTSFPAEPIPAYVKEINVILQVIDGLAPS